LADDLGYGDLASYGAPAIRTPNLDRMAAEGVRLTQFTVQPLCTPTRGALLTGLHTIQIGLIRVLGPGNVTGIDPDEVTLGDALKARGYRTAAIGKWHLGDAPPFLPLPRGSGTVPLCHASPSPPGRHGFGPYCGTPAGRHRAQLGEDDHPAKEGA